MYSRFSHLLPLDSLEELRPEEEWWIEAQILLDEGLYICPHCDEEGWGHFCGHCGRAHGSPGEGTRLCSNRGCGYRFPRELTFCPMCGTAVSEVRRAVEEGTMDWEARKRRILGVLRRGMEARER